MTALMKLGLAVSLVFLLVRPAHAEGTFSDHYDRAQALIEGDQYSEALKELEAAYAIRQLPRLLRDLALAHRRLGNAKEALSYDRRFLTADASLDQPTRAMVEAEIAELVRLSGEAPPVAAPAIDRLQLAGPDARFITLPVHYEMRINRGLVSGGITLLTTGYAAALLTGSTFLALASDYDGDSQGSLKAASGTLLIPVLGPFISSLVYRQAYWSLPWTLVDGAAQVAGLAMIIAGARSKHKVAVYGERISFAPYTNGLGGGLIASGKF